MAKYLDATGLQQVWTKCKGSFLSLSGGNLTGNLTFSNDYYLLVGTRSNSSSRKSYISAGAGYSPNSGRYGIKVLACDQSDCQSGMGQDLGGHSYGFSLASCHGTDVTYSYIEFVDHEVNDTSYNTLGYFKWTTGGNEFYVYGSSYSTGGFKKVGSSNSEVLLGGGGTKAISDFATSGHNHDNTYLKLSGGTITNTSDHCPLIIKGTSDYSSIEFRTNGNVFRKFGIKSNGELFTTNVSGWASEYVILHSGNYSTYCAAANHTHSYLPLAGGTSTGTLKIKSQYSNGGLYELPKSLIFETTNGGTSWDVGRIGGYIAAGKNNNLGSYPGGLYFATKVPKEPVDSSDDYYNTQVRAVIDSLGQVGIGTTSPQYLLDVNGTVHASSFTKSGGTSSQFLKADGSVDSSSYSTTSHNHDSTYLKLSGGTLSSSDNVLNINSSTSQSWIYFYNKDGVKASCGYYSNFAFIANEVGGYARIGVNDSGVPQYWDSAGGSHKYTLYHSGNLPAYPTKASWNYDDVYIKLAGENSATGSITFANTSKIIIGTQVSGSSSKTGYISAGIGYSTSSGRYGVKIVCCDQSDCQSGLGQDLAIDSSWSNAYNFSVVGGNSASDYGYISFVTHKANSTTYRWIGGFYDNAGTVKFKVPGEIIATTFTGNATSASSVPSLTNSEIDNIIT